MIDVALAAWFAFGGHAPVNVPAGLPDNGVALGSRHRKPGAGTSTTGEAMTPRPPAGREARISSDFRVCLDVFDQLVDLGETQARDRVGASVVDGDATGVGVRQGSAREDHVGHVAHALVITLR